MPYNLRNKSTVHVETNQNNDNDHSKLSAHNEETRVTKSNKGKRKQESDDEKDSVVLDTLQNNVVSSSSSMLTRSKKRALIITSEINTLPSEILAHIFAFLLEEGIDHDDQRWNNLSQSLIRASRVCAHWHNSIVNLPHWNSFSLLIQPFNLNRTDRKNLNPFFNQLCFKNVPEIVVHGLDTKVLTIILDQEGFEETKIFTRLVQKNSTKKQIKESWEKNSIKLLRVELLEPFEFCDQDIFNLTTFALVRKSNQKTFHTLEHISKYTNLSKLVLKGYWKGVDTTPLSKLVNLHELETERTNLILTGPLTVSLIFLISYISFLFVSENDFL
eukprot:TRINITY_DN8347_c0_g1_i1.p1 TRINITY_DN8347_c0_g1~~TRINITY_DN8347_c0_g1_i1.p1  ORF type:complete len:330 (+),score=63.80 TRINITY_DN8347_c0_g1_i1:117-1106(+)